MTVVGLLLASDILGTPVPVGMQEEFLRDSAALELQRQLSQELFESGTIPENSQYHVQILGRPRDRVLYHLRNAFRVWRKFIPNERDRVFLNASPRLNPLLYLVRPPPESSGNTESNQSSAPRKFAPGRNPTKNRF